MKSVFLLLIFVMFPILGLVAPFVSGLGYLWVDLVRPQEVSYSILKSIPVSLIMFMCTMSLYVLLDRKEIPRLNGGMLLLLMFGIWISITTLWAEMQVDAIRKWDWAVKGVGFGFFLPFLFRSRVQIESVLAVINFSAATLYISYGGVTILTGGGYGNLTRANHGIAESSTLSMICILLIPINMYFYKHSLIFKDNVITKCLFIGLILLCTATMIGTFARTGLISGFVLVCLLFLQLKSKRFLYLILVSVAVGGVYTLAPEAWFSRMNTMGGGTEELDSSALGRLAIWAWTLDYVAQHPFGGGFDIYRLSSGEYFGIVLHGKAFHSAYFEVLGEHGYVGIVIYGMIYFWVLATLRRIRSSVKGQKKYEWLYALSNYMTMCFLIYAAGSSFIGIAFQPVFYYFVGLTVCLKQYYEKSIARAPTPAAEMQMKNFA